VDLLTSAPEQDGIPRMRSLPEKTYEHWASLYISSRFPRDDQWWPSSGEDTAAGLRNLMTPTGGVLNARLTDLAGVEGPRVGLAKRPAQADHRPRAAREVLGWPISYAGVLRAAGSMVDRHPGCEQCCGACTCHGGRGSGWHVAKEVRPDMVR